MKAIVQERYGPPEMLAFRDVDMPAPGDGQVLLRVRAAGVNPLDWHLMRGTPYLVRLAGTGLRRPKRTSVGVDVAGVVEAVADDVTTLRPGDEVFGWCRGAFAEHAVVPHDQLAAKPADVSFEQAAAVPVAAFTALQALRDHGEVQAGQRVLILGASGGVGTFAVQIAKWLGAHVTAVCSTRNLDLVRSIGADEVVDYTREDVTRSGRRWDVVLHVAGDRSLSDCRRVLAKDGTLVLVGGESGGRWLGPVTRLLRAAVVSPFVGQRLRSFVAKETHEDLVVLRDLLDAGAIVPVIDRTFTLPEVPEAIRYVEGLHARGKVVITV